MINWAAGWSSSFLWMWGLILSVWKNNVKSRGSVLGLTHVLQLHSAQTKPVGYKDHVKGDVLFLIKPWNSEVG